MYSDSELHPLRPSHTGLQISTDTQCNSRSPKACKAVGFENTVSALDFFYFIIITLYDLLKLLHGLGENQRPIVTLKVSLTSLHFIIA